MTNIEASNSVPETSDFKKQLMEQKEKMDPKASALDGLPDAIPVKNKGCKICGKAGVFEGTWLTGGTKKMDDPGKGVFVSGDGKLKLDGEWYGVNNPGVFKKGKMTVDGKNYDISKVTVYPNDTTKMASFGGVGHLDKPISWKNSDGKQDSGNKYGCTLDENFKLSKIAFAGVTLNLSHRGGKTYLRNIGGREVEIASGNIADDEAACWVAIAISKVKNSGKRLGHFESWGQYLQADYKNTTWDKDLIQFSSVGVDRDELVDWLNASKAEFGI